MPKSVWQLFPGRGPVVQALLRVWEPPLILWAKASSQNPGYTQHPHPEDGAHWSWPRKGRMHSTKGRACAVGGLLPPPGPAPP